MSEDMPFTIRVPEEIAELTDDTLISELSVLDKHEKGDALTESQRKYLVNLRSEMYKRISVDGPYADYEGGPE